MSSWRRFSTAEDRSAGSVSSVQSCHCGELEPLMFDESLGYVGQFFPEEKEESSAQIVIEIAPDEEEKSWKAGFYLIAKGPLHFENSLRKLCKAASRSI